MQPRSITGAGSFHIFRTCPYSKTRYLIIASHVDGNVKESLYSSYRVEIPPKDKEGRHEKVVEARTLPGSAQSPLATPSK
jgi:hypothetical protein